MNQEISKYKLSLIYSCPFKKVVKTCSIEKARKIINDNDSSNNIELITVGMIFQHEECFNNRLRLQLFHKIIKDFSNTNICNELKFNKPYTNREQQIIRLVAENFLNKEIADLLFISNRTVENHRKKIRKKIVLNNGISIFWEAIRIELYK